MGGAFIEHTLRRREVQGLPDGNRVRSVRALPGRVISLIGEVVVDWVLAEELDLFEILVGIR